MATISEEKLGKYFAKAFREVVLPVLEDMQERMATKDDLKNMATKKDVEELRVEMVTKVDIDRIERKLTKKDDQLDRHSAKIDDHEKRISTVEGKLKN